jgi:ribosomal protein S18 acetylase RimI-like enzyme
MEIWDAYKADGNLAGSDLVRGERIPDGLFHLVCEVLVQHIDGSYLLMQRDINKESYPGKFEATAGGSALKGESPVSGAIRELQEETGIITDNLTQIYHTLSHNTIYYEFLCITSCDKSSVTLQVGETISYIWLSKDDFLNFINTNEYIPVHRDRLMLYLERLNEYEIVQVTSKNLDKCFAFWDFEHDTIKKARIIEELESEKRMMFACIKDDNYIAGFSLKFISNSRAYLAYLVVKNEYRNKGIGSLCIDYAIEYAKKHRSKEIFIKVDNENIHAKRLYERKGFLCVDESEPEAKSLLLIL